VAPNVVQEPVAQACVPSTNPALGDTNVTDAGWNPAKLAEVAAGEPDAVVGTGCTGCELVAGEASALAGETGAEDGPEAVEDAAIPGAELWSAVADGLRDPLELEQPASTRRPASQPRAALVVRRCGVEDVM
jgi:hypothetical protein